MKHHVKIVATIGPASDSQIMIETLAKEGVNVFRINLSHCSREYAAEKIKLIRRVEKKLNIPFSTLIDLRGPKVRLRRVILGTRLNNDENIIIDDSREEGDASRVSINHPETLQFLTIGAILYFGDGLIKLEVVKKLKNGVRARVIVGGDIRSGMGFSAQGFHMAKFILTPHDREDVQYLESRGADMFAVSFIEHANDVDVTRKLFKNPSKAFIVGKLETAESVKNIRAILDRADAVMIARGDLGFSLALPELPHVQKAIIDEARAAGKPVITATQMLESMTRNPFPTRAEVADVANAILDGTDAVMLSDETALGKFPDEAVKMMRAIIERGASPLKKTPTVALDVPDAVASSVVHTAEQCGAKLIVVFTESGATARRIARYRPQISILALSPSLRTVHTLTLSYGVHPIYSTPMHSVDQLLKIAHAIARKNPAQSLKGSERFVVSAGIPFGKKGSTNLMLVQEAG